VGVKGLSYDDIRPYLSMPMRVHSYREASRQIAGHCADCGRVHW